MTEDNGGPRGIEAGREFTALPVLADALEEAGCDRNEVLRHLRDCPDHECGCWVVDAILRAETWPRDKLTARPSAEDDPMRLTAIAALLVLTLAAQAEPKKVVPGRDWSGVVEDAKLAEVAPKGGLITDAKTFEKVWQAWRKDEKIPDIDFKTQFVVATLSRGGPNKPRINAMLDDGKLTIRAAATRIGGAGFGYSLATFDREGVKQVGDAKLP